MAPSLLVRRRALSKAFSLIELLVVVSILAMLVSLLLPSLGAAKESARVAACLANQRQFGVAIYAYGQSNKDYLPLLRNDPQSVAMSHRDYWFKRLSPYVHAPFATTLTDNTNTVFTCPSHETPQVYSAYGLRLSYGAMEVYKSGGGVIFRFGTITTTLNRPPLRLAQLTVPSEVGLLGENNNYIRFEHFHGTNPNGAFFAFHHEHLMNFLMGDGHAAGVLKDDYYQRQSDTSDLLFFNF